MLAAETGVSFRTWTGVGDWWDMHSEQEIMNRTSHYLLYRKVIDEEAALLARLARELRLSKNGRVLEWNTDAILYTGGELPCGATPRRPTASAAPGACR